MRPGAVFFAFTLLASAQTSDTAGIHGFITDSSGASIVRAQVKLDNLATGFHRETETSSDGTYVFNQLQLTGSYQISAGAPGFTLRQSKPLDLRAGETAEVSFVLSIEETRGSVSVTGTSTGVLSESAQIADFFSSRTLQSLPIAGRRLTSVPLFDSSVRSARGTGDLFIGKTLFVINGAGRKQTSYFVDGVGGNDAWNRQTIATDLPILAVQEIAVLANAFSAEYGWGAGGVMQVNSLSGTNNIHGALAVDWRPGGIQARPPLANIAAPDRLWQGNAIVSGPFIKDRFFYSIATQIDRQDRDAIITSRLAPGQIYHGHIDRELALTRFDYRWTDSHFTTLGLRLDRLFDTNPSDLVSANTLPSAARYFGRNTYTLQLGDTWILNDRSINEFRAGVLIASPITRFAPFESSTQFMYQGLAVIGDSRSGNVQNHQYQLADTLSLSRNRHDVRIGVELWYSNTGGVGQDSSGFVLGQFVVKQGVSKAPELLKPSDIIRYQQSIGRSAYNINAWGGAGFVQDNWKIRRDLTLMAGLRYQAQTLSGDRADFMPRLGLAWQPGGSSNSVFRASYGLYYSQIRAVVAGDYTISNNGTVSFSAAPGEPGFPSDLKPFSEPPNNAIRDVVISPGDREYYSQFFDISKLSRYPDALLSPRTQLIAAGFEHKLAGDWILSADYTNQHTTRIDRQLDINAPAAFIRTAPGQVRTVQEADKTRPIVPVPGGYRRILAMVNDGWSIYYGLRLAARHRFGTRYLIDASYTLSDSRNTVEPDSTAQDPNDANLLGTAEEGPSILNQKHRAVLIFGWTPTANWSAGVTQFLASGQPFAALTGADNNGDLNLSDRPVVDGKIVPRNWGEGTSTYTTSIYAERLIPLNERFKILIRAEGLNLLNHNNFSGRNPFYGNAPNGVPAATFGAPMAGTPSADPGRQFQFQLRLNF